MDEDWIDDIIYALTEAQMEIASGFAEDTDSALLLPITNNVFWVLSTNSMISGHDYKYQAMLVDKSIPQFRFIIQDGNLPKAICLAWLDWRKLQETIS